MNHIFEREGVTFDVQYRRAPDGVAEFGEIRDLGANYLPTGPNLTPLLHNMMVWTKEGVEVGRILAVIAEDLPC